MLRKGLCGLCRDYVVITEVWKLKLFGGLSLGLQVGEDI